VFRSNGAATQPRSSSAKIAFLIAAHTEPALLARLVRALQSPWAHVFVHIDAKGDIGIFLHELADMRGVTLIRNRVAVHWGGWSQVEASLQLIRAALESDVVFGRFALLSGSCYPLKSNEALRDFLFCDEIEHITAVPMPSIDGKKPLTRLTRWHIEGGDRSEGPKGRTIHVINDLLRAAPRRDLQKGLEGLSPYAGSNWWVLTRDAVQTIMRTVEARPTLVSFFRRTYCPDESFFHTVLANSPLAARIGRSLTYAVWSPGPEQPQPIGNGHMARLLDPGFAHATLSGPGPVFFARKFCARNAHLLDEIDAARETAAMPLAQQSARR
jgi:hypothetical protein